MPPSVVLRTVSLANPASHEDEGVAVMANPVGGGGPDGWCSLDGGRGDRRVNDSAAVRRGGLQRYHRRYARGGGKWLMARLAAVLTFAAHPTRRRPPARGRDR